MGIETWTANAKLRGNFVINDERRVAQRNSANELRELMLAPVFDSAGKFSNEYELTATLDLVNDSDSKTDSNVVFERAKSIIENICAIISVATGRPVTITGSVSATRQISTDPLQMRLIMGCADSAQFPPPTPLNSELLTISIDKTIQRVIRWWARGVANDDPIDRLMSLNNALDLLAGLHVGAPGRTQKCSNCGHQHAIEPGLRERIVSMLTTELDFDLATANAIYESRLDLAHARSRFDANDIWTYRRHSQRVEKAVRTILERRLNVALPATPPPPPFHPESEILDVVYVPKDAGSK